MKSEIPKVRQRDNNQLVFNLPYSLQTIWHNPIQPVSTRAH